MALSFKSACRALGVPENASLPAMREAYVKVVKEVHPDKGGTSAAFRTVQSAWVFLKTNHKQGTAASGNAKSAPSTPGSAARRPGGSGVASNAPSAQSKSAASYAANVGEHFKRGGQPKRPGRASKPKQQAAQQAAAQATPRGKKEKKEKKEKKSAASNKKRKDAHMQSPRTCKKARADADAAWVFPSAQELPTPRRRPEAPQRPTPRPSSSTHTGRAWRVNEVNGLPRAESVPAPPQRTNLHPAPPPLPNSLEGLKFELVERLLNMRLGESRSQPESVAFPEKIANARHYSRLIKEVVVSAAEATVFSHCSSPKPVAACFAAQAYRMREGVAWLLLRARASVEPPALGVLVLLSRPGPSRSGSCFLGVTEAREEGVGIRTKADPESWSDSADVDVLPVQLDVLAKQLRGAICAQHLPQEVLNDLLVSRVHAEISAKACASALSMPWARSLAGPPVRDVLAACELQKGISLVSGLSPRTFHPQGKSVGLLALVNALHLQETESLYRKLEDVAICAPSARKEQWRAAMRCAPRIIVLAASDAAADEVMRLLLGEQTRRPEMVDKRGRQYCPEEVLRVRHTGLPGNGSLEVNDDEAHTRKDLHRVVQEHWVLPLTKIEEGLAAARHRSVQLQQHITKLCDAIHMLHSALPLPLNWEVRINHEQKRLEYHNHTLRKASWSRPQPPMPGDPTVGIMDTPEAVSRFGKLMPAVAEYRQAQAMEQRFELMGQMADQSVSSLRARLQESFIGHAEIVVTTLETLLALPASQWTTPFRTMIVCGAASVPEASVLVALQALQAGRCVLVNDGVMLPLVTSSDGSLYGRLLQQRKSSASVSQATERRSGSSLATDQGEPVDAGSVVGTRSAVGSRAGESAAAAGAAAAVRAYNATKQAAARAAAISAGPANGTSAAGHHVLPRRKSALRKPPEPRPEPRWKFAGPVPTFAASPSDAG